MADDVPIAGDAIGGDVFWRANVHAYRALIPNYGIYATAFANSGALSAFSFSKGSGTRHLLQSGLDWRKLVESARVSVGGGIAARTSFGLIELVYTVPLCWQAGDRLDAGFQVGATMTFS